MEGTLGWENITVNGGRKSGRIRKELRKQIQPIMKCISRTCSRCRSEARTMRERGLVYFINYQIGHFCIIVINTEQFVNKVVVNSKINKFAVYVIGMKKTF